VYSENMILALGCQDEMPPRPIVCGGELKLALSILSNQLHRDSSDGFPLH